MDVHLPLGVRLVRTVICGSRDAPMMAVFMGIRASGITPTVVLCGDARGADTYGALWAKQRDIPVEHYPAEWNKLGKGAGHIRNVEMVRKADALIAIWDGVSRGTAHAIETARNAGLTVYVHTYK